MQDWVGLSEIVRNLGIVLGGAIGLVFAWMRVRAANRQSEAQTRQAEVGRREHVAELFNRAVGQLDDEKLHIRLGAIYTLREISQDFPDLTKAVLELLATYLRNSSLSYSDAPPPPDVREIMRLVRERIEDER
ncbi:MAG: hypothetical protein U1E52_04785 [Geminicoccaceae bacterium]